MKFMPLQWGHDRAVVELPISASVWRNLRRFNGATTARSWNYCQASKPLREALASMGPRPRGRGIASHDGTGDVGRGASMGPRPRGRGISADACVFGNWVDASMGPRPRGRGIALGQRCDLGGRRGFNGATTARSWNSTDQLIVRQDILMLQWGHDRAVVELALAGE